MREYILLVIILKKRMFPRHIWQVYSALTPELTTAEITNIHFLLKCFNESGFLVLFLFLLQGLLTLISLLFFFSFLLVTTAIT